MDTRDQVNRSAMDVRKHFSLSANRNCRLDDEFKCKTTGQCIPRTFECDAFPDCSDESDEANCGQDDTSESACVLSCACPASDARKQVKTRHLKVLPGPEPRQSFSQGLHCDLAKQSKVVGVP